MSVRDVVVGIDCSTTACKALVFTKDGALLAEGRASIPLHNPAPDAWEQDAESWWSATAAAVRSAVSSPDVAARIAGMCVTHQRETFVVTDEGGHPLHPALVWMDARCSAEVARAVSELGAEELHAISGKPPCKTPSMYKLMYLLDELAPTLREQSVRVLDVHAFVVARLTGRPVTSLASADPLGLVDMKARTWSAPLLQLVGLDARSMPALVEPGAEIGGLLPEVARKWGLPSGLPVVAGAGDGQAAGVGAGIAAPGRAYLNLGTAVVSGVLSHEYRCDPSFRTLYGAKPGTYFLETDLQGGTFTLSWLAQKLAPVAGQDVTARLGELEREAEALRPGADGLVLVPYLCGVMNPYWDDAASGVLVGLRGEHGPAHLYRAVIEGLAFEQRLHTAGVERVIGTIDELVVMGGGARSDLWCHVLADITGKRITRAGSLEATGLGAAVIASAALGLHANLEAATAAMTRAGRSFMPGPHQAYYDRLYREVYEGLYLDLRDRLGRLAKLQRAAPHAPTSA